MHPQDRLQSESDALAPPLHDRGTRIRPVQARQLWQTLWPLFGIGLLLLALSVVDRHILSGIRAYVSGESLWSKAQKQVVIELHRYAETGDPVAWREYRRNLQILLGDRRARETLERPDGLYSEAAAGFREGQNAEADIPALIRLFRTFRHRLRDFDHAVSLWQQADAEIAQLDALARTLKSVRQHAQPDQTRIAQVRADITRIDLRLRPMAEGFSRTLGELSRWAEQLLGWVSLAVVVLLAIPGIWLTRRLVKRALRAQEALQRSEERYALAMIGSQDGLWDCDLSNHSLYCSPHLLGALDLPAGMIDAQNMTPQAWQALLHACHADDRQRVALAVQDALVRGAALDVECRVQRGAKQRWLRIRGVVVRDQRGQPRRMVGALSDVTEREQARNDLLLERERAHAALNAIAEAVLVLDVSTRVHTLNPIAARMLGVSEAAARGQCLEALLQWEDEGSGLDWTSQVAEVLAAGVPARRAARVRALRTSAEPVPIDLTLAPLSVMTAGVAAAAGVVMVLRDLRPELEQQAQLRWQACHDALTGLGNRLDFEQHLHRALLPTEGPRAATVVHTLLYIDLDHFKPVNDQGGHAAGDALLKQIAKLIGQKVRREDRVARMGGDEFAVLLPHCEAEAGLRIAQQIVAAVAGYTLIWQQRTYRVGASIGVVALRADGLTSVETALGAADAACYLAKGKGRGCALLYATPRSLHAD